MSFLSKLNELFGKKPIAVEKPVELKKRTKKLVSRKEMVDLGVTYVMLKFSDGRELITKVYGQFSSGGSNGNDQTNSMLNVMVEPYLQPEELRSSQQQAQTFIKNIETPLAVNIAGGYSNVTDFGFMIGSAFDGRELNTYTDCPRVPTKSEVGKVITATILRTESNLEEVTKYSVEKI